MADVRLKVSIDEMKRKTNELTKQINKVEKNWNRIQDTVNASKSYWEGDAGDVHRKFLKDHEEDVQTMLKRLKEHPRDLLDMAGIYLSAEEQAKQLAKALPKDVIR